MGTQKSAVLSPTHIPVLDGVRGAAILLVLFHHSVCFVGENQLGPRTLIDTAFKFVGEWSDAGVDLFFVLSGFLITGILLNTRSSPQYFSSFYKRRALRIFPLYLLFLFFSFHIVPLFEHSIIPATTRRDELWYWLYLGNIQMFLYPTACCMFLTHTWSLAVEEQFYLVWPFIVRRLNDNIVARLSAFVILLSIIFRVFLIVCHVDGFSLQILTPARLDLFAAGALLTTFHRREIRLPAYLLSFLGALGSLGIIVATKSHSSAVHATLGTASILTLCFTFVALSVQLNRSKLIVRMLESKIMTSFGKYSYSIYLFHAPIIYATTISLVPFLLKGASIRHSWIVWSIEFVFVASTSWLLGKATYYLFEQRFLKLKNVLAPYRFKPRATTKLLEPQLEQIC